MGDAVQPRPRDQGRFAGAGTRRAVAGDQGAGPGPPQRVPTADRQPHRHADHWPRRPGRNTARDFQDLDAQPRQDCAQRHRRQGQSRAGSASPDDAAASRAAGSGAQGRRR